MKTLESLSDHIPLKVRIKLYRQYLETPGGRRTLAQSMIDPAGKILSSPRLTRAQRRTGKRILRWGERLLGRALVEGHPVVNVQIGQGHMFDRVNFPKLLVRLREKLGRTEK